MSHRYDDHDRVLLKELYINGLMIVPHETAEIVGVIEKPEFTRYTLFVTGRLPGEEIVEVDEEQIEIKLC